MTRRRLWVTTTVCCALLALPTLARLIALVTSGAVSWTSAIDTGRHLGAVGIEYLQTTATWAKRTVTMALSHSTTGAAQRVTVVPAPAALPSGAAAHTNAWTRIMSDLASRWQPSAPTSLVLAALVIALMALAVLVSDRVRQARRAGASQRARRLADRGGTIGMIARRTGLSQDAVRQLIHPPIERDRAAFADLLAASLDPNAGLPGAFGARRGHARAGSLQDGKGEASLTPTTLIPGSRSNR